MTGRLSKSRLLYLAVAGLLLPVNFICAQIALSVRIENTTVLQFEPLHAYVTLVNDSDEPFIINCDDPDNTASVAFRIERDLNLVQRINVQDHVVENLRLAPDDRREIMIDISQFYDMSKMGTYLIAAVARSQDHETVSRKIMVDVVHGMDLTSVQRAAAGYYDGEREYSLLCWNRNGVDNLFLRVDGIDDEVNYGVFALGKLLRVIRPTVNIDRRGNIEVFHQPAPTRFVVTKFKSTYDGVVFVDQTSKTEEQISVESSIKGEPPQKKK